MFVLQSYSWAVVFCVITMFCWGSWANTQKLARKGWRFELLYWDYTIGVLLLALIVGLTLGSSWNLRTAFPCRSRSCSPFQRLLRTAGRRDFQSRQHSSGRRD